MKKTKSRNDETYGRNGNSRNGLKLAVSAFITSEQSAAIK